MGRSSSVPVLESDIHSTGDPNIFRVESGSNADTTYIVDMTGPVTTCTCTRYAITRNRAGGSGCQGECKHLNAVEDYIGSGHRAEKVRKEQEAAAAATEFERVQIAEGIKNVLRDLEGL